MINNKDQLATRGHLHNYQDRTIVFLEQLHFELDRLGTNISVLDVGCGHGIALETSPQFEIAKKVDRYLGVEPDTGVTPPNCFQRVWHSSLEDSNIPDASIDLAYSQMVLEHVTEPEPFLAKLSKVLKPGGVFVSLTVNGHSTFARIAATCHNLGIQDIVLRIARGKQVVDDYHYPAVYKMCSEKFLNSQAPLYGFDKPDLGFFEADEWLAYFPTGTKWAGNIATRLFQRKVERYTWLLVKLTKQRDSQAMV